MLKKKEIKSKLEPEFWASQKIGDKSEWVLICEGDSRLVRQSLELMREVHKQPAPNLLMMENLLDLLRERGKFYRAYNATRFCLVLSAVGQSQQQFMQSVGGLILCSKGELRGWRESGAKEIHIYVANEKDEQIVFERLTML